MIMIGLVPKPGSNLFIFLVSKYSITRKLATLHLLYFWNEYVIPQETHTTNAMLSVEVTRKIQIELARIGGTFLFYAAKQRMKIICTIQGQTDTS